MIKEEKMGNRFNIKDKLTVNLKNNNELEINTIWISLNGLIRN